MLILDRVERPSEDAQAVADPIYEPGNGVSLPSVVSGVHPDYTPEAKAQRIQGTVLLAAVVRPDGTVADVSVLRPLDATFGLDREAVAAMRQWRFTPGQKDGKSVAVRISVEMTFALK
jgi:protein TonB